MLVPDFIKESGADLWVRMSVCISWLRFLCDLSAF